MSIELFKLEGMDWWIEADTVTTKILAQYNKPQVEANIAAIVETLKKYPDPKTNETYYSGIITLINASAYPAETKTAAVAFMAEMWQAYGQSYEQSEAAELRARLVREQDLLKRLV